MERDDQEKGHKQVLFSWDGDDGGPWRRLRTQGARAGSIQGVMSPDQVPEKESKHASGEQDQDREDEAQAPG